MNVLLVIHNIGAIVSAITAIGVAIFLFANGKKKTASFTLALGFLGVAIFYISHVIGVNISDPNLSRLMLMGNLVILFIGVFNFHAVLATVKKDNEYHFLIVILYIIAAALTSFFLFFPDLFLLPSTQKSYFINYYEPGMLNWVRLVFLYGILVPSAIILLYQKYKISPSDSEKKQLEYFIITMIVGYGAGFIPNFLIYGIPIDPLWGILFVVICAVPLIYGAIRYELLNIQIIAKQAFLYSLAVAGVGGFITALNYLNVVISALYPDFPTWTISLVSALLAVSASVFVWRSLREGDHMKAEFITTVTHKFRTPLTYIKWAADNLSNPELNDVDRKAQLGYIRSANEKLVELTNILTTASDATSNESYGYNLKQCDISRIIEEVIDIYEGQFVMKHFTIVRKIDPELIVRCDEQRIKFVLQVLIENAIHYSEAAGTITVHAQRKGSEIVCSVEDTGIGMSAEELSLIFSKFYRGDQARSFDTEGLGIALYISSRIMENHSGRIWGESLGSNKGSTFYVAIPQSK